MKTIMLGILLGLVFIVWIWAMISAFTYEVYTITEDMPEWNCQTMGNKICGDDGR